jgi:Ca2+-binding EF-hand superfamily protein
VAPSYFSRIEILENTVARTDSNGIVVPSSEGGTIISVVLRPDIPSQVKLMTAVTIRQAIASVVVQVYSKFYTPTVIDQSAAYVHVINAAGISSTNPSDCTDAAAAAVAGASVTGEEKEGMSKSLIAVLVAVSVILVLFLGLMFLVRQRHSHSKDQIHEMRRLSTVLQSHGVRPRQSMAGEPGGHFYPGQVSSTPAVFNATMSPTPSKPTGGSENTTPGGFAPQRRPSFQGGVAAASFPGMAKQKGPAKEVKTIERKANAIFRKFDADGDGELDLEEVANMIRAIQYSDPNSEVMGVALDNFDAETLAEMMSLELDENGDGGISRVEFVHQVGQETGLLTDLVTKARVEDLIMDPKKRVAKKKGAAAPPPGADDAAMARRMSVKHVQANQATGNTGDKAMAIFMLFDADGNGSLSMDEMGHLVKAMIQSRNAAGDASLDGLNPESIAKKYFKKKDLNKQGELSRENFGKKCEEKGPLKDMVAKTVLDQLYVGADKSRAVELYQMFDTDGNGDLDLNEMMVMVEAMAQSDPTSLTSKEISAVDPSLIAEMMQLEFDEDGDGTVTLDEFTDKVCNSPGLMAELVMHTNLAGFVNGKPVVMAIAPSEARRDADAALAAAIRRRIEDAKVSSFGKSQASAEAAKAAERAQHQANAGDNLREQEAQQQARAAKATNLTSGVGAAAALSTDNKTAELFGRDPALSGDPTAGKSKIWMALNPQSLAKQTAAERREQQDARVIGADSEHDSDDESDMGFGSDSGSDFSSSDDDFDDADLELDPATAAKLEAARVARSGEEASRKAQLGAEHASSSAAGAAVRAEEMAVIEARQKIERRASQKEEAELVAAANIRMASELKFDFDFFTMGDADGDGMLSLEEAMAQGMSEDIFRMIDADGNGQLTEDEFKAWMSRK